MPCITEEPTGQQRYCQETARLLQFVRAQRFRPTPLSIESAARNTWGTVDYTPSLCAELRELTPEQFEKIVYDAHNPMSRALATWWERHERDDAHREIAQRDAEAHDQLKARALAKLTSEEIAALGLKP